VVRNPYLLAEIMMKMIVPDQSLLHIKLVRGMQIYILSNSMLCTVSPDVLHICYACNKHV